MSTTLPLFWHLSSSSKQERVDASVKLLSALNHFQAQFTPKLQNSSENESDQEDQTESDGLDALNAHDVVYSIRRLIRGLSSPRESSRLGYAVALTELLSQLETVTCSQIVSLIIENSKASGSVTGQEERDSLFARLFGLTAVIQSGLLVNPSALPASASSSSTIADLTSCDEVISQLIVLGEKKSWLRESAWWSIGLAIDTLESSQVSWRDDAIKSTFHKLFSENGYWSPEKVALALKLQPRHPDLEWKSALSPVFKNPRLLSSANLPSLARIMKESGHEAEEGEGLKPMAGGWKPQIHFAWKLIIDHLLDPPAGQATLVSFQEFFRVVVDETLFASSSSAQRKYWGFQIFQAALPRLDATSISMLFTTNFMRTWINHLSHPDRYLHKAAKQVASDIQATVKHKPQLGFALVLQLTGANGSRRFDRLTKTKTVETILASMDTEGIQNYIEHLLRQMEETPEDREDTQARDARRSWVIEQLASLIRNGSIPKNDTWVQHVLDWLAVNGLYIFKKHTSKVTILPVQNMSDDLRQTCRTRLLASLAELTSQIGATKGEAKSFKIPGTASDGHFWICRTLSTIQRLDGLRKYVEAVHTIDDERAEDWDVATATLATLQQKTPSESTTKGAELLLAATIIQQYCSSEQEFDTLNACVNGITSMFPKKKKKQAKSEESEDSESEPIDILVDVIIGLMERSTNYLRIVSNQAFGLLSESVRLSTVDLILTQLERRDPSKAEEEDEEDEDIDDEDASDDLGAENSADSSDDEDSEHEEDAEIRNKIESALHASGLVGDEDSEDEQMDDEQMMAIDQQLAEIFRSRTNEKLGGKDMNAQRDATHFKNRVLDLVETFIKKQPSSDLLPRFILPLTEVIVGCGSDERQLADKAKGILQSRIGKLKEMPSSPNVLEISAIFSDLHARSRKQRYSGVVGVLSQCSLYLSRILISAGGEEYVLKEYKASLSDFFTRKACTLNSSIFQEFFSRHPSTSWKLVDDLLDLSASSVNVYRQCQAFHLVQVLLSQLAAMDDRQKKIEYSMPNLRKRLSDVISAASEDQIVLSAPQMKDLFKLGLLAERQTMLNAPDAMESIWQPDTWTVIQSKLESSARYKGSKPLIKMCHQMAEVSGSSKQKVQSGVVKRKAPEVNGDGENYKAKRKRSKPQ